MPTWNDCNGYSIEIGDTVESPANATDPIVGKVAYRFVWWPFGTEQVLIGGGCYHGYSGSVSDADCCKIIRKQNESLSKVQ